jgi:hypothetical protein
MSAAGTAGAVPVLFAAAFAGGYGLPVTPEIPFISVPSVRLIHFPMSYLSKLIRETLTND